MAQDVVLTADQQALYYGATEFTVAWLEANPSDEPRWVYVGESADVLTESQYLDLAT